MTESNAKAHPDAALRLALMASTVSVLLGIGLWLCYFTFDSQLALAQAADSTLDVVAAAVLLWTVHLSRKKRDDNHHFGHERAEPLGALLTAGLTGALSIEVLEQALGALLSGNAASLDSALAVAFSAKVLFKAAVYVLARKATRHPPSPALDALAVDARNDVLVGVLALFGYGVARAGWPMMDAWLALPLAGWIGWSGFVLGMENVRLLMGEAPSVERQELLLELARKVDGVLFARSLRAQHMGPKLWVELTIEVDGQLNVSDAHDIGELVERALCAAPDVEHVSAHVEPRTPTESG